jgi:serine/threonine-protein kinase
MSDPVPPDDTRVIEQLCEVFDAEWKAGRRPAIESSLDRAPAPQRSQALRKLLLLELEHRLRAGETILPGEYPSRFPADGDALAWAYASSAGLLAAALAQTTTWRLRVVDGPSQGQLFTFAGPQMQILGRSDDAHLLIKDDQLSRLHVLLEIRPPACWLTDLNSRNGTMVNGQRVQSAELHPGDTIQVGRSVVRVEIPAAAASPFATEPAVTRVVTVTGPLTAAPAVTGQAPAAHDPYATNASGAPLPEGFPPKPSLFPRIEGHEIQRELGRGGMGVVYLARRADGTLSAIKTVKPAVVIEERQLERFKREAAILRQLEHHHIVRFYDAGEADGLLFFAMEYIDGTDAARMLAEQGRLPVRDAVLMICQLLSALKYAHDRRFVHRDIKPGNILIGQEGGKKTVKLADFGLARVCQESQLSGITFDGEVGGTTAYLPPEQIKDFRNVSLASDQYATAATLYTLLTGKCVFDPRPGEPQATAIARVLQEPPVPIRHRQPDLPEELASIIHKALAKEPAERFPSVREFREALVPFVR